MWSSSISKRMNSPSHQQVQPAAKRLKMCTPKLERLSRSQLEKMVSIKIVEAFTANAQLGKLIRMVTIFEQREKEAREKIANLQKQLKDLDQATKGMRTSEKPTPPQRIIRSVGLQVTAERIKDGTNKLSHVSGREMVPEQTSQCVSDTATRLSSNCTIFEKQDLHNLKPITSSSKLRTTDANLMSPISKPVPLTMRLTAQPISELMSSNAKPTTQSTMPHSNKLFSHNATTMSPPTASIDSRTTQPLVLTPPNSAYCARPPPPLNLEVRNASQGLLLKWWSSGVEFDNFNNSNNTITTYEMQACSNTCAQGTRTPWKTIGHVDALMLPMACTLDKFKSGKIYHFRIRSVCKSGEKAEFSKPVSIYL